MPARDDTPTIGIDIGGSSVKAALLDGDERFTSISPEYVRPDRGVVGDAVRRAVHNLPPDRVARAGRVGLCVPGRMEPDGSSIGLSYNLPGLVGFRFEDLVRQAIGRPTGFAVLGDALAGTLDAARLVPSADRVFGIAIGTGVGAALVRGGRGEGETGGFGQTEVGPIGDNARCTVESVLGLPAWRARFGASFGDRIPGLSADDPALVALGRAVRAGTGEHRPDAVVLLGGLGLALSRHAESICKWADVPGLRLAFGTTRFHAAFGAARHARATER